jgi:ABC-2 type transport system permease protein
VKYSFVAIAILVVVAVRVVLFLRRRRRRLNEASTTEAASTAADAGTAVATGGTAAAAAAPVTRSFGLNFITSDIGLVAAREVQERLRGKIFRIGTLLILAVVAGSIIIPKLDSNNGSSSNDAVVGVVGGALPEIQHAALLAAGKSVGITLRIVQEPSKAAADRAVRSGRLDLAIVNGRQIVIDNPIASNNSSNGAQVAQAASQELGVAEAFQAAGLTPAQAGVVADAKPLPVQGLVPGKPTKKTDGTSLVGLILVFVMLTQYNTWILIGVMEEKSSRVVEVLLAALRSVQLLAGKVLGIGTVALAQATLIVSFALILGAAVGSDLLKGTGPLDLVSTLIWLILGYAFYCWVYAAAGSMAERQDQVQSLAFPLTIPIMFGYIFSIITISTGNPSLFYKVLAYIPLTAPFAMPTLVGLGDVSWWQFVASALVSVAATFGVAKVAGLIYQRSILRTGRKVTYREVLSPAHR